MSESCSGNCQSCGGSCSDPALKVRNALAGVEHKIVVMSGKGGVGKSTVAVNLALALALDGRRVGLLDVDVHGPSVPAMLGIKDAHLETTPEGRIRPVEAAGLKVVSVGFLLDAPDTPVIWRGPVKIGVIQQFLSDVDWDGIDTLVVDCPPGTGDEPLSVCQLLLDADGAVVVTTPQRVAALDVAKSVKFCEQVGFPVLGLVENMAGFACPHCGEVTRIFPGEAGAELAARYGVPLLGSIPIDPLVAAQGDAGLPFIRKDETSPTTRAFLAVVGRLGLDAGGSAGGIRRRRPHGLNSAPVSAILPRHDIFPKGTTTP